MLIAGDRDPRVVPSPTDHPNEDPRRTHLPIRRRGIGPAQCLGRVVEPHRYNDPDTAAYLTPDPLGLAPSPNDCGYVVNNGTLRKPGSAMTCEYNGVKIFGYLEVGADGKKTFSSWFPD